jgi:HPt (histidine-containing phosphotransfer) domain-containing protein
VPVPARFRPGFARLRSGHCGTGGQGNKTFTLALHTQPMDIIPPLHAQGPAIDRAHLDRMTGGDQTLALEVLGLFREQGELWLRLLEPDTATADWAVAAHTIKGAARGIGAWSLGEVCGAAEAAASQSPLSRNEKQMWREQIAVELDLATQDMARIEHQLALASLKS